MRELNDSESLGDVFQMTFRLRTGGEQGAAAYLVLQPYFRETPRFLIMDQDKSSILQHRSSRASLI